MFNDFVIVGPTDDPVGVAHAPDAASALALIAAAGAPFASRGDNSGTHVREKALWAETPLSPTPADPWYLSLGQGMGATLQFANERGAYTLTDRGTFLALQDSLPNLQVLFKGETALENPDAMLRNDYSVIPVNPDKHPDINNALAEALAVWLISPETQARIGAFGVDRFGQPLFFPVHSTP